MRYTMFIQGEGVLLQSSQRWWAVVQNGIVMDASISAANRGIRVGMAEKTAKAVLPQLVIHPLSPQSLKIMQTIWNIVESYTPWLEAVDEKNRWFYAQIPAGQGSSEEVREIIYRIHRELTEEQRIRVGLAESKIAARVLVEWSKVGRVRGAGLFTLKQQQLIVSPGILRGKASLQEGISTKWTDGVPVAILWALPENTRKELLALGVRTFGQFQRIPDEDLKLRFGKDIWDVKGMFEKNSLLPPFRVGKNSPGEFTERWVAPLGECIAATMGPIIAEKLLDNLMQRLFRAGVGVGKLRMRWETDKEIQGFSRAFEKPLWGKERLLSHVLLGLRGIQGETLQFLEISAERQTLLAGRQASFVVKDNRILPMQSITSEKIHQVLFHLNRKFPDKLMQGIKPGFRELRLKAIDGR